MDPIRNTFDAGLLGRELDGHSDLPQYYRGTRIQDNMISKPSGGARLRPGFEHIEDIEGSTTTSSYPTLQELTAAELPTAPTRAEDMALVSAISVVDAVGLQAIEAGKHYSIDADIDLSGVTWTPLVLATEDDVTTVIAGNNHTISNLTIDSGADKQGFIGEVGTASPLYQPGGGQIRDLHFVNCSVTGGADTAVFCGWFLPKANPTPPAWSFKNITFTNCAVAHTTSGTGFHDAMGIMFGEFADGITTVSDCTATNCTVTSAHNGYNIGGLVGQLNSQSYVGSGDPDAAFIDCDVVGGTMTLAAANQYLCGGFYGGATANVHQCHFYGCSSSMAISYTAPSDSDTVSNVGSFCAHAIGVTFTSCTATGDIGIKTGGFSGVTTASIGGFIGGSGAGTVRLYNCSTSANIVFSGATAWGSIRRVGGFIGYSNVTQLLLRCWSSGSIIVENDVTSVYAFGGFVGGLNTAYYTSVFDRCWSESDITFEADITAGEDATVGYGCIGGFAGHIEAHDEFLADFLNCYTWTSIVISGTYDADISMAGFIGGYGTDLADLTFTNCYCAQTDTKWGSSYTDQIPAGNDSHGFAPLSAGHDNVRDTSIYFDTTTSSLADGAGVGVAKATAWLQTQSNFEAAGWTFDTIWEMDATTTGDSSPIRLVRFINGRDRYILEFGDLTMRVYKGGTAAADALVMDGTSAYTVVTPWAGTEVWDLVFAPKGHAIFHPDYETRRLECDGDADWTLTAADFIYGPFLKQNDDVDKTLTPSDTEGSITLTAAGHTPFTADHVGSLWRLSHVADAESIYEVFSAPVISSSIVIAGAWTMLLDVRFAGDVVLQKSLDGGASWVTAKAFTFPTAYEQHLVEKGEELDDNVLYRFNVQTVTVAGGTSTIRLTDHSAEQRGIVEITAFSSSVLVTGTVKTELGNTYATYKWAEGAFSDEQGYPSCGTIHESRIIAANTTKKPNTIWAGGTFKRLGDERVMYADVDDNDAFWRTVDLEGCDTIEWMASLWLLLFASNEGAYKGIGASEQLPMTPRNSNFLVQSGMGAGSIQPIHLAGFLTYTSRNDKRVYEVTYSNDTHVYQPTDLTFFNPTVAGTGIKDWAFQQQPYPILWAVTDDGNIAALTRDRDKGILAWYDITTDGEFKSVATIPGDAEDEVWVVVNRDVEGIETACVERLKPFDWGTSQRDCFFVDGGTTLDGGAAITITGITVVGGEVTVTAAAHGFSDGDTVRLASVAGMTEVNGHVYTVSDGATNTFKLKTRDGSAYIDGSAFTAYTSGGTVEEVSNTVTGLTQLASETVDVLLDGQPSTGTVTAAGVYTVGTGDDDVYFNTIHVGRHFTGKLAPMRPEIVLRSGSTQGRKKKIQAVRTRLYRSAGGRMGTNADDVRDIDYADRGDPANADVALCTEDRVVNHPGGWDRKGDIYYETTYPLPFTVSAILFEMEIG